MQIEWASERFELLPERAVWWPAAGALLVADLHLGKPAAFRASGVPVPEGCTDADLSCLAALVARFNARRLIILGDLLHARTGRAPETLSALAAWRLRLADVQITLVRGNHDRNAGDPPHDLNIHCVDQPLVVDCGDSAIALCHEPPERPKHPTLCGHLHPFAILDGAPASLRAPCFWFSARCAVLPAFGRFTGGHRIRPRRGDRVFLVGPNQVIEAPTRQVAPVSDR